MSSQRALVVVFSLLLIVSVSLAQQRQEYESEWDALIKDSPQIEGSLFYPLPTPCPLFSLEGTTSGEPMALIARGDDLSQQGGSANGCGIPDDATALMIQLRMASLMEIPVSVKLWPTDVQEPVNTLIETFVGRSDSTMVVVPLGGLTDLDQGELQISSTDWCVMEGQVTGYFGRPKSADNSGGGISFFTEAGRNNYFGSGAGGTGGEFNSFFGGGAGSSNTGSGNSFFGYTAGSENTSGSSNSFFGIEAGFWHTTGDHNSFFGRGAGSYNKAGNRNSYFGSYAGQDTSGSENTFVGWGAGMCNIDELSNSASGNTFVGFKSGYYNTTGDRNVFVGKESGYSNFTGQKNTAVGENALRTNTEGKWNTALGMDALLNSRASWNTAVGNAALLNNTTGEKNTAVGQAALYLNNKSFNTAIGQEAGYRATGSQNTFSGFQSGYGATLNVNNTGNLNSFFGYRAGYSNTTGGGNTFLGVFSGIHNTTGSSNTFVGRNAGSSNTIGIGNVFLGDRAGWYNTTGQHNSFVGNEAGTLNIIGSYNSFFGQGAGYSNIGYYNSFFGQESGYFNTTGIYNSFFGQNAGIGNTVEHRNTFLGAESDLDPGNDPSTSPVENATAIGYRAYVSQSSSLVLGSIAGVNEATDNVNVGIGTTSPSAPLHVNRSDATSRIILAQSTSSIEAPRNMMDLVNNGIPQFRLIDSSPDGDAWQFSNTNHNLNISLQGSGSQEFLIENDGDVWINNGTIMVTSYRASKENFQELDTKEILRLVADLPLSDWNYKKDKDTVRHIGPVSEDFYQTFGYGEDDKHISPNDLAGVAIAAAKGLYRQLQAKDAQLETQQQEIENLKVRLTELETLKQELANVRILLERSITDGI
jgi:hypothetical protein